MADAAKKEKIAAAKKRLKQFQQQKKPSNKAPGSQTPSGKEKLNGTNGAGEGENRSTSASPLRPSTPVRKALQNDSIANPSPTQTKPQDESTYSTPQGTPANNSEKLKLKVTPTASTEKLQQLSRQINGLIVDSSNYLNDDSSEKRSVAELEARNRELASLLHQHTQVNEQLNKQLQELKSHNSKLQTSLEAERSNLDDRTKRDVGALKEQLQVHIQTIGILVAEKTELQSSLNQCQKQADARLRETEELQGRLKASRTRVADLERSFTSASSSTQKLEKTNKDMSKEVDRLKLEMYKTNKLTEELQQQNTELQGKLQSKSSDCGRLEDSVIDLKGRLEMAELHVEQLKNGGSVPAQDNSEEVERLVTERSQMQSKLEQYDEAFQRLTTEREQVAAQYQQVVTQISSQNEQLQHQVASLSEQRDTLQTSHDKLEQSFHEIQSQQNTSQVASHEVEAEKQKISQEFTKLNADFEALKARYDMQVADNTQLGRLIAEKEMKIEEMELSVQRANDNNVDRDQLLDAMQSDKTALSRAMAQNKELKTQLAELQNGFVKMSNDNMDLMTSVTSEQHVAKELAQRLSQQEDELKDVREQLSERERHIRQLESDTSTLRLQHYSNDQIEDRLRHYEAQAQLVETLQRELNSAQDTINALTNQHSMLQSQMSNLENGNGPGGLGNNDDLVASLNASIRQLEMERNEVVTRMRTEQERAETASSKLQQLQTELAHQTPATLNGDVISKAQFEALQHAMKQLESKYTTTMRDKADLSDKNEQMEHLIMQLQGETETIGEYVTLYQHQRSVMRKRAVEKDDFIARLSRERGEMQEKTTQLQTLVLQLLNERQHMQQAWQTGNHVPATTPQKQPGSPGEGKKKSQRMGKNVTDRSKLEEWPDYTSDSDSDTSEVEAIVGGSGEVAATPPPASPAESTAEQTEAETSTSTAASSPKWNIPGEDQTAQKIMSLLSEIGNQSMDSSAYDLERSFINCKRCTGRIMTL